MAAKKIDTNIKVLGLCGKKMPASLVGCAVGKGNKKTGSCRTALTYMLPSPNMFPPWLLETESTFSQDNTMPYNFVVRTSDLNYKKEYRGRLFFPQENLCIH